jgi:hypothetical protein
MVNNDIQRNPIFEFKIKAQRLFIKNINKVFVNTCLLEETITMIKNFANNSINLVITIKDIDEDKFYGDKFHYDGKDSFIIIIKNKIIQKIKQPFWSIYYSHKNI